WVFASSDAQSSRPRRNDDWRKIFLRRRNLSQRAHSSSSRFIASRRTRQLEFKVREDYPDILVPALCSCGWLGSVTSHSTICARRRPTLCRRSELLRSRDNGHTAYVVPRRNQLLHRPRQSQSYSARSERRRARS